MLCFLLWSLYQIIWTCSRISDLRYLDFVDCMYLFVFIYSKSWMICFLESFRLVVYGWVFLFVLSRTWGRFLVPCCSIRMFLWMLLSIRCFQSAVPFVHSYQPASFFGLFCPYCGQISLGMICTRTNVGRNTVADTRRFKMVCDVAFPASSEKVLPCRLVINRNAIIITSFGLPEIRIMRMVVFTRSRLLSITLHNLLS